ncbi:phosphoribosyltransferase [Blastococcus sp. SYSU D00820]
MSAPRFADRRDAGRVLAEQVAAACPPADRAAGPEMVVLGLPRGGVVVAAEVARALAAPLDVLVVRKLGLPARPELAMGAIAAVGDGIETVRNAHVLARAGVDEATFAAVQERELAELRRRTAAYRGDRPPVPVEGRTVVLVDDGIATGATARAAVAAIRQGRPAAVVLAVPVAAPSACADLAAQVDALVVAGAPAGFRAVGQAYADFGETSDEEVRAALDGV